MCSPIACLEAGARGTLRSALEPIRRMLLGACLLLWAVLSQAQAPLRYDLEFPVMNYSAAETADAVADLRQRLERAELQLDFHQDRGYLDAVLGALGIDVASQLLVFSKTSLQINLVSPATPRAIYFNDTSYVAWVPGTDTLEIATMDPRLGPVFYTLPQQASAAPRFQRQLHQCLRCHDSLSLTGGGTPRFMMSSNYTGRFGQLVSHEGSIITNSGTPLRNRWGGWFVTGSHGDQLHLGNVFVASAADLEPQNLALAGNRRTLESLTDTGPFLSGQSDIVALLVIEHQIELQNRITRANYLSRRLLADEQVADAEKQRQLEELAEQLLRSLFMVDQASLGSPVAGYSGFDAYFSALGPADGQGRSLRELDLSERVFKYPLSYLVYSDAFAALPGPLRERTLAGIRAVLSGSHAGAAYGGIGAESRQAMRDILRATWSFADALE